MKTGGQEPVTLHDLAEKFAPQLALATVLGAEARARASVYLAHALGDLTAEDYAHVDAHPCFLDAFKDVVMDRDWWTSPPAVEMGARGLALSSSTAVLSSILEAGSAGPAQSVDGTRVDAVWNLTNELADSRRAGLAAAYAFRGEEDKTEAKGSAQPPDDAPAVVDPAGTLGDADGDEESEDDSRYCTCALCEAVGTAAERWTAWQPDDGSDHSEQERYLYTVEVPQMEMRLLRLGATA